MVENQSLSLYPYVVARLFGIKRVQGSWLLYWVIPDAHEVGRRLGRAFRYWCSRKITCTGVAVALLSLAITRDSGPQAMIPGWATALTPGAWGQLTIRQLGDINAKILSARLGQAPLEIVPFTFYRSGPQTASLGSIAEAFAAETHREVMGAVNGGFFDLKTGLPLGFLLRDGQLEFFNMPQGVKRSMVGFTRPASQGLSAQVVINSPDQMPKVWLDRLDPRSGRRMESLAVHHVNVPGGRDALSLFTERFAEELKPRAGEIYWIARERTKSFEGRFPIYEVSGSWDGKASILPLPAETLIIRFAGDSRPLARSLHRGSLVQARWSPPEEWKRRGVVHGLLAGPRLLEKGRIRITAESERLAALKSRDRVALGVKADGEALLVWFHHEKRGANLSFEEVARTLQELKVTDAIALDGGSSRAIMAVARDPYRRGRFLFEGRPVSNALFVSLPADRT